MSRPRRTADEKVVALPELRSRLRELRASGATVVFTNGCYDLLHVGHLRLLEEAARLGEVLLVGMNGDESVTRLKGPGRPLVPFEQRALLLAALEVVDLVVRFDEDTPGRLIAEVVPDVLVKGGDWPLDRIVGREVVESHGGRVVTVPLVPGRSTSALLDRIRGAR